ncbi:hypothetical protein E1263_33420 [Kribbella antibiotica]|uniref:LapA family protein n=1 Tax=Kribbella antibiotica TaxID=190195 RepID=A0A4R4YSU8_9ACTN|nr:hypothetical protein [Kribbella antibiotica]TDD48303.1 hypothetical protein E1263_33420 [Kribbella antibiotica]
MFVLGIVLLVIAVLFGLGVSVSSTESTTLSVFGIDFGVIVPTVFFLGAAAGAALIAGIWLTKKGLARGWRRHREIKNLRAQVTEREHAPVITADRDAELADETPGAEHLVTEEHVATDPTDHKQPH